MSVGLGGVWRLPAMHWICLVTTVWAAVSMWLLRVRGRFHAKEMQQNRRIREEIETYARLDARLPPDGDIGELATRICQVVAKKSVFYRVAMLVRDTERGLYVAGSLGMDAMTVKALHALGERVVEGESKGGAGPLRGDGDGSGMRVAMQSFAVVLGADTESPGFGRAIVVPLWTTGGRMVGALAVGADQMLSIPRRVVEEAIRPLEMLAVKLSRTMENFSLAERLQRAEKLAGLGLLAGGVAHALNNPLTAVLGFAELIAETSKDPRVQEDAGTIVREALRIRETMERLLTFWRPAAVEVEQVDMTSLLQELTRECEEKLANRGVQLAVQAGENIPCVRGNRNRLREVMEHLLNNAAQAIASAGGKNKEPVIRVAVSHDDRRVQVIVSDTGPGFRDPERVFDPFYTARGPGEGAGLGLSICYGIVREHGGEISVFNLHPHGAAVAVELPVRECVAGDFEGVVREVA
ncbi:MAG: histidine kinase [Edaphobacter sp.]|nr:histidine kinase [Edaphobacter sp.]